MAIEDYRERFDQEFEKLEDKVNVTSQAVEALDCSLYYLEKNCWDSFVYGLIEGLHISGNVKDQSEADELLDGIEAGCNSLFDTSLEHKSPINMLHKMRAYYDCATEYSYQYLSRWLMYNRVFGEK